MKVITLALTMAILLVFLSSACVQQSSGKAYTLEEVSEHDSENDCWMVINGKVYDITSFVNSHPGGEEILDGCGIDATQLFETRPSGSGTPHSESARNTMESYYIGNLEV